jgi:hypothetical protein
MKKPLALLALAFVALVVWSIVAVELSQGVTQ